MTSRFLRAPQRPSRTARPLLPALAALVLAAAALLVPAPPAAMAAAPFGNALRLDGVDDYARIADNASLDLGTAGESFTAEALVHVPDTAGEANEVIFYKQYAYALSVNFNTATADYLVLDIWGSTVTKPQLGVSLDISAGWHHVAAVFDNRAGATPDAFAIFWDGTRVAYNDSAATLDPGVYDATNPLSVGANSGAVPWSGWIDEARLSASVRYFGTSYTEPAAPFSSDATTRALWHFDDTACATAFADSSGNGNTLTGYNGAQTGLFGAAAPGVQLSSATYNVREGDGAATIGVERTGDPAAVVGVSYATADATATAGSDYSATSGTLSLACGEMADAFSVPIFEDAVPEDPETVTLSLSDPTGGATLGSTASATLTITDGDDPTPVAPAWAMYGHDAAHAGRSPSVAPTSPLTAWTYPTGDSMNANSGAVVGGDGSVYATTWLGFFALDPDGTQRCTYPSWASAATAALSPDGTVVYVPDSHGLHALDTDDCSVVWELDTRITYSSPTVGADGTVYVGSAVPSETSKVYAVRPDGAVAWTWDSGSTSWIESSPALGPAGLVYVVHNGLGLVKLDATGSLVWNVPGIGEAWNHPTVAADGTVFVGDTSGMVALNPDSTTKWTATTASWLYYAAAALSADGSTIYRGDNGGRVYAFDTATGTKRWTFDTGLTGTVSAPALSDNGVLAFTVDAEGAGLFAISAADGAPLWQAPTGRSLAAPVIGEDGTLYGYGTDGSGDAVVHAFGCGTDSDGDALGEHCDPPQTTITSGPSGSTTDSTPTFAFTSDEPGSTFQCRVDTAAFTSCASPYSTGSLPGGAHSFSVRATDPDGNTDPTAASRSILVSVEPAVVAFGTPARTVGENVGTTTLTLTRSGNTAVAATVSFARTAGTASGLDLRPVSGSVTFPAGATTRNLTLTVVNDALREAAESAALTLSSPGAGVVLGAQTTAVLTIRASDQRPDAWISNLRASRYAGNDVYNTTGTGQTRTQTARRGQVRTFYVRVYNDGNVRNTFALHGSAAPAGSSVGYLSGTRVITRSMRSAAGHRVTLGPGRYTLVTVRVTVRAGAVLGSRKAVTVRGTWTGDGTRADLAKAVVRVIR